MESTTCNKASTVTLPGADQKKQEILGALISGITHEINTPMHYLENNLTFLKVAFKDMSRLLDNCQVLLSKVKSGKSISEKDWQNLAGIEHETDPTYLKNEIGDALKQSLEGINMVSRLVLALKDFSHPSLHEISLTDINKCIDTVCTISRHEWKRVAEMQLEMARDLPYLYASRDELHQVLLNLIVNAAQAIGEKIAAGKYNRGRITIRTACENDRIVVEITDDGPGIPQKNLDLVFNPHFTTKEAGKGTGIGLSLVKKIVEQAHGGEICLRSDEAAGTSFKIYLPHRRHEKNL